MEKEMKKKNEKIIENFLQKNENNKTKKIFEELKI